MRDRRDNATLDLFSGWEPPEIAPRFAPETVRAATLAGRVCRAVSAGLKAAGIDRAEAAARLGAYLGEDISRHMLDAWASEARGKHIAAYRLFALAALLERPEMLNAALEDSDFMVVPRRFEPLIRRELAREDLRKMERIIEAADAACNVRR